MHGRGDKNASGDFGNHFDFNAGTQRQLRHAESRTRMLALLAEHFTDDVR